MKPPFFIIGSVRSGTTMLRDVLKLHPNLICPEETHMFRWSWPYGTEQYLNQYTKNPTLVKHRAIDGIEESKNQTLLNNCNSKADYTARYMAELKKCHNAESRRWFDKTPQHVYGLLLIAAEFPGAKFVHIYRNPLNIVSSLRVGKVIKVESLIGAINYWREAVLITYQFRQGFPKRCLDINYETFTQQPYNELQSICEFIGEENIFDKGALSFVQPERNKYQEVLSKEEIEKVRQIAKPVADRIGMQFQDINI